MTQVDFYILKPTYPLDLYKFTCRLIDQVYAQGRRIYVHADSDAEATHLDRLLWTFRDGSFIAHGLLGTVDSSLTPVLLGSGKYPEGETDVLINLASVIPEFFSQFQRVAEIMDQDQERLRLGRERFRRYKELGCTLNTHDMTPST